MKTTSFLFFFLIAFFSYSQAPNITWQKTIGGNKSDQLKKTIQTTDGGYLLAGSSDSDISGDKTEAPISVGIRDFWLVKINPLGNIEWQKVIGGSGYEYLTQMIQTTDGGFAIAGYSSSLISGNKTEESIYVDYWVVKIDALGNIQWQNTITGDDLDFLGSISQTADGGYILGGQSDSGIGYDKTEAHLGNYLTPEDFWIVKLDSLGNIQWENTIGGTGGDELYKIIQTPDGGYIAGGTSGSGISVDKTINNYGDLDFWILKLSSAGIIEWQNVYGGSLREELRDMKLTSDGGYILGGDSYSGISGIKTEASRGLADYWLIKINNAGNIEWDKTLGGSASDYLTSVVETQNSGYLVCGYSSSSISGDKTENNRGASGADIWLIKINSLGIPLWQKTIGGSSIDNSMDCFVTSDNGLFISGTSRSGISGEKTENSQGSDDYWLVKLDPENLSVNENTFAVLSIYPNPTSGLATLKLNQVYSKVNASIINTLGQEIQRTHFSNTNQLILNFQNTSSGMYFINLELDNGNKASFKVIKEN